MLITHRLPDGRRRIQLLADTTTGEMVTFASEAEAQAVAERMQSVPGVEFRAAPLDALEGEYLAIEIEEEERRNSTSYRVEEPEAVKLRAKLEYMIFAAEEALLKPSSRRHKEIEADLRVLYRAERHFRDGNAGKAAVDMMEPGCDLRYLLADDPDLHRPRHPTIEVAEYFESVYRDSGQYKVAIADTMEAFPGITKAAIDRVRRVKQALDALEDDRREFRRNL